MARPAWPRPASPCRPCAPCRPLWPAPRLFRLEEFRPEGLAPGFSGFCGFCAAGWGFWELSPFGGWPFWAFCVGFPLASSVEPFWLESGGTEPGGVEPVELSLRTGVAFGGGCGFAPELELASPRLETGTPGWPV